MQELDAKKGKYYLSLVFFTILGIFFRVVSLKTTKVCWFEFNFIVQEFVRTPTTYIGVVIIFLVLFLKLKMGQRVLINLIGNCLIWIPIFVKSYQHSLIYSVTEDFYKSIFIVALCVFFETMVMIIQDKVEKRISYK